MSNSGASAPRPYALITGASSGIGLELARELARRRFDVLMVAEDHALTSAAHDVERISQVSVATFQTDLRAFDGVERLWTSIATRGRPIDALALNAGVGVAGPFVETRLEDDLDLLRLNIDSVVHLAKRAVPTMVDRRAGRVLITASLASLMPGPYYATYAASKAFLLSFAEGLRHEVREHGVTVTALLPGPTDTNFFHRAGMEKSRAATGPKDDPAAVARDGVDAMLRGRDHVVAHSLRNRLQAPAAKLLPARVTAAAHARLVECP